jgi:3-oxoacyl-[acyl-carrier-protein] synthase-3
MSFLSVRIAGTGSFLPGQPIPNDRIEAVLGALDIAPYNVKSFVKTTRMRMLDRIGVQARHFAIDPSTGDMTHNFSKLAEEAARKALEMAQMVPEDIELLIISCPGSDQHTPPTSTILQEQLGIRSCAEVEIHSNCTGVGKGVQIAFDSLRTNRYQTALVVYSQLSSIYLRSSYFNQLKMNKVHATLRWILADGSGALVLKATEKTDLDQKIIDTYVESVGGNHPPGMTAGAAASDLMKVGSNFPDCYESGSHHLWQDFPAVNTFAGPLLLDGICRFIEKIGVDPHSVDHYVISVPSKKIYEDNSRIFLKRLGIPSDRIKFRCENTGYCGGATILIHFDEMVRTGEIKQGDFVIVHSVESSKWMTAGFAVRW